MISHFLRNNMHLLAAEKHQCEEPDILRRWRAIVRLEERILWSGSEERANVI